MFRRAYDALTRLFGRPRSPDHVPDCCDLTREVRAPDPYVWRLPDPYDARWRRWDRRNRAVGHRLASPREEECWRTPPPPGAPQPWGTSDDVVRLYVLRP
ncbi:hypothetical protein AB0912_23000 [Streptomyces sp. NPDC007084]|uniref:hypothetical protein n=1 Tax=Streptomyces sp. NPDC007084 TaxID=3154313 RepID=UPI0034565559